MAEKIHAIVRFTQRSTVHKKKNKSNKTKQNKTGLILRYTMHEWYFIIIPISY